MMNIALQIDPQLSAWDMIVKGGWLMIPIFLLSIIAVWIFIERWFSIRKINQTPNNIEEDLKVALLKNDQKTATEICQNDGSPMSLMLIGGIKHFNLPASDILSIIENDANAEVTKLERGLNTLSTCATLAPMIGFLGTVVGMIQAFYDMALAGSNINIGLLSRGIYTAMITTVAGLVVGILASMARSILSSLINRVIAKMDKSSSNFMDIVYSKNEK